MEAMERPRVAKIVRKKMLIRFVNLTPGLRRIPHCFLGGRMEWLRVETSVQFWMVARFGFCYCSGSVSICSILLMLLFFKLSPLFHNRSLQLINLAHFLRINNMYKLIR